MEEFTAILKAREFVRRAGSNDIPVDVERLAAAVNARIRIVHDLADDESGQTTHLGGKQIVVVNGQHSEERQRFTVLHEVAHIFLGLSSQHHESTLKVATLMRYERRPQEEVLCDVFAAECLLPYHLFGPDVSDVDISMGAVKELASKYKASLTSTGSRFAVNANGPCAFVLGEDRHVRYVSRSKYLNELKGWIDFNIPIPRGSVAHRLLQSASATEDYDELPTDVWFNGGIKNHPVALEESIVLPEWNQCLSLIWFDKTMKPLNEHSENADEDEPLLRELDGVLPWPSRSRRR